MLVTVARYCGIPKQRISDLRAGRRRFTRRMAEGLLMAGYSEPWGKWLVPLVEYHFSLPATDAVTPASPKSIISPTDTMEAAPAPATTTPKTPTAPRSPTTSTAAALTLPTLPLLTAPFQGDPRLSRNFENRHVELPRPAADLATGVKYAYVLELPCEDHARRLRVGDQVLILPTPDSDAEIQIVVRRDLLRLARRVEVVRALGIPLDSDVEGDVWVALDSGKPLTDARPVAHVACIVWARL